MTIALSTGFKNALIGATGFASIFNNGKLRVYTGSSPGPDYAATGTKLLEVTIGFTTSGGGAATLNGTSGTTLADGVAGYFRISDSSDNPDNNSTSGIRIDGVCSDLSDGDIIIPEIDMVAGRIISTGGSIQLVPAI